MKVFICWSGERSKKVAETLHGWLKRVMPQMMGPGFIWHFHNLGIDVLKVRSNAACLEKIMVQKAFRMLYKGIKRIELGGEP